MDRDQVLFRLFGKYYPEGTILYTEGSQSQELYVVQSGAVRLGAARAGAEKGGASGPGNLLGEGSFFLRTPHSTRAEVVQDARLIQVNDRSLDAFVRHGPQTAHMIFGQLLALTTGAKAELALWTVARLLRRIGPVLREAAGAIHPGLLAERAGLAESDVVEVLEELRRRGRLVREGDAYLAGDVALLQREIDELAAAGEHG